MSGCSPKGFTLLSKVIDHSPPHQFSLGLRLIGAGSNPITIIFDLDLLVLRPCHTMAYDMQSEMSIFAYRRLTFTFW